MTKAADFAETVFEDAKELASEAAAVGKEKAAEAAAVGLEKAAEAATSGKERAAEVAASSKEKAVPLLTEGKALAAEKAASGKEKAAEAAAAVAAAAKEAKDAAPEELGGEPERKRGRWVKRILVVGGIAAVAAFVAKKLRAEDPADNWQSSYVPAPPPTPVADADQADDAAGSAPDEALADAAEEPHPVTTPDAPAEAVDVDAEKPSES